MYMRFNKSKTFFKLGLKLRELSLGMRDKPELATEFVCVLSDYLLYIRYYCNSIYIEKKCSLIHKKYKMAFDLAEKLPKIKDEKLRFKQTLKLLAFENEVVLLAQKSGWGLPRKEEELPARERDWRDLV